MPDSRTELGETKPGSRTELGETVPSRTELAKDDREAAIRKGKQRQLRLKALLAASAHKLAQLSLFCSRAVAWLYAYNHI